MEAGGGEKPKKVEITPEQKQRIIEGFGRMRETEILVEAADAIGKPEDWDYDFESMSDEELYKYAQEVQARREARNGGAGGSASTAPENPAGSKAEKKKKIAPPKVLLQVGGCLALVVASAFAGRGISKAYDRYQASKAAVEASADTGGDELADTDSGAGAIEDAHYADGTEVETSKVETEHVYGERYENIAEVSTYKGLFANENGDGYNENKVNKYAFGPSFVESEDEEYNKNQLCEALTQPGVLATYYAVMDAEFAAVGDNSWGVENLDYDGNPNTLLDKIEADSDLHQQVYDMVHGTIQGSGVKLDTVTGKVKNFYFDADFAKGDIDENGVEVVGCETTENGSKVLSLSVEHEIDGVKYNILITIKEACRQPIDKQNITVELRQVEETPAPTGLGLDVKDIPDDDTGLTTEDPGDYPMGLDRREEEETPPPDEETPPPDEETPPPDEETPPPSDAKNADDIEERLKDAPVDDDKGSAETLTTDPVNEDTDGDGDTDYDDKDSKNVTELNDAGGVSPDTKSATDDGQTMGENVDKADTTGTDVETGELVDKSADESVAHPAEREAEEKAQEEREEKEEAAEEKADEMEATDRTAAYDADGDNVVTMEELGFSAEDFQ